MQVDICTADIYDTFADELRVCSLQFRSFGKRQTFFGPAETLVSPENHTPVLAALSEPGRGRVLIVDSGSSLRVGVLGDRLAAIAVRNGWAGIVVNGAVRDTVGIDELDIGIKALGATARRNWTTIEGQRGVALEFGDVTIGAGDWVYADRDAVLISSEKLDLSKVAVGGQVVE